MNYAGLHVHTHYSLFDGVATPEEYVDRAVELGMPALAITDHGTLSGHRELYRIAKAKGVKPIPVLVELLQRLLSSESMHKQRNILNGLSVCLQMISIWS